MQNVQALPEKLRQKKGFSLTMTIGLDGFVDEIIHIVDKRQDYKTFTRVKTIKDYGEKIIKAAGLSTNFEMVTTQTKLGGNGPILSNALLECGVEINYVGALGNPDIHPVFAPMAKKAKSVYSLINPGLTDALEFEDGKLICGKHSTLAGLTWEVCKNGMGGVEGIAKLISESHLFGMENWTMMPHMSDIWQGMIDEVFPLLPDKDEKPLAFFDLADPEKRTATDIKRAMELIGQFESKFRAVLGLNEKEAREVADVMGIKESNLENLVMQLYKKLNIYCLMVHPTKSAMCVVEGKLSHAAGPYCEKPALTTGAGDNFNSGFCLGMTLGLTPLDSLTLGVCTSGFYVRNAKSPTYDEIIEFCEKWGRGEELD